MPQALQYLVFVWSVADALLSFTWYRPKSRMSESRHFFYKNLNLVNAL